MIIDINPHYVHVVGPYDNTFVGPFADLESANIYVSIVHAGPGANALSAYVLTEKQFRDNVAAFGAVALQSAEGTIQ